MTIIKKTIDGEGVVFAEVKENGGAVCEVGVAPSISAAVRSIQRNGCESILKSHSPNNDKRWYGRSGTFKDIIEEAQNGRAWKDDAKQVHEAKGAVDGLENFSTEIVKQVRELSAVPRKVIGLSIDAILGGDDRMFRNKRKRRIKRETIALFVPINALANVKPKTMMFRMAATLAAAQILEAQGQCVEIYSVSYSHRVNGSKSGCAVIKVKTATAPLNLEQAASAMSAWAFRTIGFAFRGTASKVLTGSSSSGSGSSDDMPQEVAAAVSKMMHCDHFQAVKCIPRSNDRNTELKRAVDAVVAALLKLK